MNASIIIVASYDVFIELAEMIKYSLYELGFRILGYKDVVEDDFLFAAGKRNDENMRFVGSK